ncbi:hypothetical protein MP638_000596 [Amoeboaphelidium occidentale]|nr:hypothetical protein MP638_000596 [Amoeboaphelidium occidentale]
MASEDKFRISPAQVVFSLLALTAFTLVIVALSGPWIQFTATNPQKGDRYFQVGLWQACTQSVCGYAWSYASPTLTVSTAGQPVVFGSFVYYDFTPSQIAAAQAFYIIGVFFNLGLMCVCAGGSGVLAIGLLFPAICYTIGYACAAAFFNSIKPVSNVVNLTASYGSSCALAALIIVWVCVVGYAVDSILQMRKMDKMSQNNQVPLSEVSQEDA